MHIVFWVVFSILSVLFALFLEFNKNTLAGWALFAVIFLCVLVFEKKQSAVHGLTAIVLYIGLFICIVLFSWPPVQNVPAVKESNPPKTAVIKIEKGNVQGVYNKDGTVEVYTGIPYAKPPVNERRWKAPEECDPWDGVLICDHFAPMSMQKTNLPVVDSLVQIIGYHDYKISLHDSWVAPVSEDSLYLNIWKPAGNQEKLPVIVYIHGGSLQTGQPWYEDYSGEGFAKAGVVTVNMGYRLGIFGFYADEDALKEDGTTGNYGLLDQILALKWVQKNISAFGGDPENVTLIGESAGAVCVDALCVSPLAKGLFQRAVLESSTLSSVSPPHSYRSLEEALESGRERKKQYHCASLEDMRKLPAERIAAAMSTEHHVTVDGYVLPEDPYLLRKAGVHNEAALLHGFNLEESGPFILFDHANMKNYESKIRSVFRAYSDEVLQLYPAKSDEEADQYWKEIYGALFFNYSHYCLNRLAVTEGVPVYEYLFTKKNRRLSCWHSGELVYVFHMIPEKSALYDAEDRSLSDAMQKYWIQFAKTGNPGSVNGIVFERNEDSEILMEFGDEMQMRKEPYLKLYAILDRMYGFE